MYSAVCGMCLVYTVEHSRAMHLILLDVNSSHNAYTYFTNATHLAPAAVTNIHACLATQGHIFQ